MAIATLIAVPIGVLVAIYVSEFANKRIATFVRVVLDVMNGIPAIVVGIFVFGVVVAGRGQSALAGSFASAILMVPMVARATQEVLALVPGATARGEPRARRQPVADRLRCRAPDRDRRHRHGHRPRRRARRRRDGAAPLHLFDHGEQDQLRRARGPADDPVAIFAYSESADPHEQALAWTAALVLISFVLVASVIARALSARSRRKLTGGH